MLAHLKISSSSVEPNQFVGIEKLTPVTATMSTTHSHHKPSLCIDGRTDDSWWKVFFFFISLLLFFLLLFKVCNSHAELAPWLALDYGEGKRVSVEKVFLYNRNDKHFERTKNVQIRISDELPASGETMFEGGEALGAFKGPSTKGQIVEIPSGPGWDKKNGRYLIIQMNMGNKPNMLNLKEAYAVGISIGKVFSW